MEAFYLGNIYVTYLSQGMCKYLLLLTYCRAHNPKVGGSNPSPATKRKTLSSRWSVLGVFAFLEDFFCTFFH